MAAIKQCTICGEEKSVLEFGKHAQAKDGLTSWCLVCKREKERLHRAKDRKKYNERVKNNARKSQYGLTTIEYEAKKNSQLDMCAICGDKMGQKYHLDHDHDTNQVRDFLCHYCNVGLGMFKDSPERLASALKYLERWEKNLWRI